MDRGEYIITSPKRLVLVDRKELWFYRDLLLVLAWRDIAVRYKQTALGVIWAVLQPVVTMIIFCFIFNKMAKIPSGDSTPYPIFVYIGLLFWQYFSVTVTNASNSLVMNAPLIQKTYFPRLLLPLASSMSGLVDMLIASVILCVLMIYYRFAPLPIALALLPILLACTVLSAAGIGLWTSALNIKYRDVRYALPFFIQIMMFVTPIIYPAKMLDGHPLAKTLMLWLNPMSGVIANARACLVGGTPVDWATVGISSMVSIVFFVLGLAYFRHTESYFADIA